MLHRLPTSIGVLMITIDFETKSYCDLPKCGAWVYSEDPTTDIICVCWAVDDGPIEEWWPGKFEIPGIPRTLWEALSDGHEVEAHNYTFEYSIWHNIMVKRYGWPPIALELWNDTAIVAAYYALPTSLAKLAAALDMGSKNAAGGRLISKYSKLNLKTAKEEIPDDDFDLFVEYCRDDVELERALSIWLGPLPDGEKLVFEMDKRINTLGMKIDDESIRIALKVVEDKQEEIKKEFHNITGRNPTQHTEVKKWFARQGLELDNLQEKYLSRTLKRIKPWIPPHISRALWLRLEGNKSSTKKLKAMLRNQGEDGRARYQSKYHGAVTGRWTGTGFQPLNLSRGYDDVEPEQLVADIRRGSASHLDRVYGNAIEAVGKASRHWIQAAPGHRLISGDFSSIEAVGLACMAGEEWKVQLFREGAEIYMRTAEKVYGLPPGTITEKSDPRRQDGKTCELAFGYQGALKAWKKFDDTGRHSDEKILEFNRGWREDHPCTTEWWEDLNDAAMMAMRTGEKCDAGPISFEVVDAWLTMILPNGKRLWYFDADLRMKMPPWHQPNPDSEDFQALCGDGDCDCKPRLALTYLSVKSGMFIRVPTYGGKLAENAIQSACREILVPAMFRVEEAGYPILMNVYDQILCEVPNGHGSVEEFEQLMCAFEPGSFYEDWPIGVEAWEGGRFKK